MIAEFDLASLFGKYYPILFMGLIFLGIIENFLMIYYGGWIKRGVMIWNQKLRDDEWQFLSTLQEDIFEEVKVGFWKYKKKSFIMVRDGKMLIRYGNPKQNTTWPMVGYVDLSNSERVLEYRIPLFMTLFVLYMVVYGMVKQVYIFSLVFLIIFAVALFVEYIGVNDFLSKRTEIFLARQFARRQELAG